MSGDATMAQFGAPDSALLRIDVLSALLWAQKKMNLTLPPGVSTHPGPHSAAPAAHFGEGRSAPALWRWMAPSQRHRAPNELALLMSVRQQRGNVGTILMLTGEEEERYTYPYKIKFHLHLTLFL